MFEELLVKTMTYIAEKGVAVLATSADNHVSARFVSIIVYDGCIAFQTSQNLLKYAQIVANKRVALCTDHIQIEGIARIAGHSLSYEPFASLYSKRHPVSFATYSHMKSSIVLEVMPTRITLWDYEQNEPYRTFIEIANKTCSKKAYQHSVLD